MESAEIHQLAGNEPTDSIKTPDRIRYRFAPGLPAVLSLVVPGLGQCYSGRCFAGFLWFITTMIGYVPFVFPGIVLHLLAIITACFRPVEPANA